MISCRLLLCKQLQTNRPASFCVCPGKTPPSETSDFSDFSDFFHTRAVKRIRDDY
jgi:hypothetical protein